MAPSSENERWLNIREVAKAVHCVGVGPGLYSPSLFSGWIRRNAAVYHENAMEGFEAAPVDTREST